MPRETFRHTTITSTPWERAWEALQIPATWEGVPGVDEVTDPTFDREGHLDGFDFVTSIGGRSYRGRASRSERDEGRAIGWNIDSAEIKGSIQVGLAPARAGTEITITLVIVSAGVLASMFFPVIVSSIGNGFPGLVEGFAAGLANG